MISGLVFTSMVSTDLGTNVKGWRLFADGIVDVGITLEMVAPLFPPHFLLLICLASVCKSMCGIAAGAANGAIVEHWARANNIPDVLAKVRRSLEGRCSCTVVHPADWCLLSLPRQGGAQHTAVSLFGLGFGM